MTRHLSVAEESWPLKKPFVIARGARTETHVVKVAIGDGAYTGIGECVPLARYGESCASVIDQIDAIRPVLDGLSREELRKTMPPGAARNALDAALWDLEAKQSGSDVGELSGLGWPGELTTVQTISIMSPSEMGEEAKALRNFAAIKVKSDAEAIVERVAAVRKNAPDAAMLLDANESWSFDVLASVADDLKSLGVVMIEQPLPAGEDDALQGYDGPVPIFADESCHIAADLARLEGKYDGINIKLDKTGGLTEAIELRREAIDRGFGIMIGCMVSTSLGIAPACFLAGSACHVDIDAPALLARDRPFGFHIEDGKVSSPNRRLWGGGDMIGRPAAPD